MGAASLVLGIISLVLACFGSFVVPAWLGVVMSIVGIVLAVMQKKKEPKGIATAGMVCSIIALCICGITAISCTICIGCAACGL